MSSDTIRHAQCSCGRFRVTVKGDPEWVNMCNCYDCQRRSGSAFHIAGFFREDQIMENRRLRLQDGRTIDFWHAYALPPD